jgi:hypothetical protein
MALKEHGDKKTNVYKKIRPEECQIRLFPRRVRQITERVLLADPKEIELSDVCCEPIDIIYFYVFKLN